METPEINKLHAERHKTELLHEFLEWCFENHETQLCRYVEYEWVGLTIAERDRLFAEFIGVDMNKVEDEKRKILEELRKDANQRTECSKQAEGPRN